MSDLNKVYIQKKNEAYLKIKGDVGVLMELHDHFTFMVDGYKFMPSYRQGRFDGKIRLFNLAQGTIYSGLYYKIVEFLEERWYEHELVESEYGFPNETSDVSLDEVKQFIKSLRIASRGVELEVRDYQERAIFSALKFYKNMLLAATSSGKSLIIYCIFRFLLEANTDTKILLIVPTIGLTTQMFNDFKDYSSINGWDVDAHTHLITAGVDKNSKKNIIISTWQSIQKMPESYFAQFDLISVDEAHSCTAASLKGIFERSLESKYRLGFTGTVHDAKCNVLVLQGLTGPITLVAKSIDLIKAGQLTPIKIKCLVLKYPEEIRKAFKECDYEKEIKYITSNDKRNKLITNLALKTKGTTLILYRFVDIQGKPLYEMIKNKCTDGREVRIVHGEISKEEREEIRQLAIAKPTIIVASYATYKQGINVPSIEDIIFGSPMKAKITNLQSIGRGLRLFKGKEYCTLWDISDDLSYKKKTNHTLNHFTERLRQYTNECFDFTITNMEFQG